MARSQPPPTDIGLQRPHCNSASEPHPGSPSVAILPLLVHLLPSRYQAQPCLRCRLHHVIFLSFLACGRATSLSYFRQVTLKTYFWFHGARAS
jgi:hypothetical protein